MKKLKPLEIKKILFVSFSNLGDAVLSLPTFDALRRYFPQSSIDVVVGERARMVFENDPCIRQLLVYEKRKSLTSRWRFFKKLHHEQYDLVVDLRRTYFSFLGKHRTSLFNDNPATHKRDQHLNTLLQFGIPVDELRATVRQEPSTGNMTGPKIVIAPGSKSDTKEWPEENFAALADRLMELGGYEVIWIGDSRERPLAERIQSRMKHSSEVRAGRDSWQESVDLIRSAALVITNDSAPLHVADHYSKKVLAFFGPTDPGKYGPQRTPEGILFRQKFCSPCEKAQCRYQHECLKEITVDEAFQRAVRLLEDMPERGPQRILVMRLDRIGDTLLSFPAIRAIRQRFPRASITFLTRPYANSVAARCPDVDEAMVYDYGKRGQHRFPGGYGRLLKEIKKRRFDVAFILHPTFRSHLFCFLADIPYRVGYRTRGSLLLTHKIQDLRHEGYQHESDNALDVVRAFGIRSDSKEIKFAVYPEDEVTADRLLQEHGVTSNDPYVILHAGSSSRSKCWPQEYFIELGHLMKSQWGVKILLAGAPHEKSLNARIAEGLGAVDLTGRTSLPCLAALMKKAHLFIANDSGPVHLAAAVGTKVISIFGRNQRGLSSKRWKPLGKETRFLQKDVGCVVCLSDACPIGFECLRALTPQEVFREAEALRGESHAVRMS